MQLALAHHAATHDQPKEARRLLAAAGTATALTDPFLRPLAMAALAVCEGRDDDARRLLDQAERACGSALFPVSGEMGMEAIAAMRRPPG
jgi:hypothetical protein